MASATFRMGSSATVDGTYTYGSYGASIDATSGYYVKVQLQSSAVRSFTCSVSSGDPDSITATLPTVTVDSVTKTATFQLPTRPCCLLVTVNVNGTDTDGETTSLAVHVLTTSGMRLIAVGETTETGTGGWTSKINSAIAYATRAVIVAKAAAGSNVTVSGEQTIDGVACVASDVVLCLSQTDAKQNGPWIVASGAWTRPSNFGDGQSASGSIVHVSLGDTQANTGWVCTSGKGSDIIGANNLAFIAIYPTTLTARRIAPTSNTYACWTLDESASPYANTGTAGACNLTNTTGTPTPACNGIFGDCVRFYNSCLNSAATSVGETAGNTFTMHAWVKPEAFQNYGIICGKQYNASSWASPYSSVHISLANAYDGSWTVAVTTPGTPPVFRQYATGHRLSLGVWQHVAMTYDGDKMRAYHDGSLVYTSASFAANIDWGAHGPWLVGGHTSGTPGDFWLGLIDEVRVENAVLSASEIREIYNTGIGRFDEIAVGT